MTDTSILKSSSGYCLVPNQSRLMLNRKVFLQGKIDNDVASEIVRQFMILAIEDNAAPIDLLINSTGGAVDAGIFLYDAIQTSPVPIRLFCMGRAYSMAAILFASGQNGRFMLPHSRLMLHEPLLSDSVIGNTSSIKTVADALENTKQQMVKLLATHTGRTEAEIEDAIKNDHYFDPVQAIEFGLADRVVGLGDCLKEG